MTLLRSLLAALVALLAIAGLALGDLPLGLDFQGGTQLTYVLDRGREEDVERAVDVFRRRLEALGQRDVAVVGSGAEIRVQCAGLDAEGLAQLRDVLGRFAQLRFVAVDDEAPLPPEAGTPPPGIEVATETVGGGGPALTVRYLVARGPSGTLALPAFLGTLPAPAGRAWAIGEEEEGGARRSFLLEPALVVTGDRIAEAEVSMDPGVNRPVVMVGFDAEGGRQFGALTERLVHRRLAIELDGLVRSAPVVLEPIRGGRAQVTLGSAQPPAEMLREAQALAVTLRSGALPSPVRLSSEAAVAPAVDRAHVLLAAAVGAVLFVALVVGALLRHRTRGLAVAAALPLAALLALAAFVAFDATLTAFSVAGIAIALLVLVATSALALERARRGRAYWPVSGLVTIAAHVSLLAAAMILFGTASGPTRGLAAGVVLSVPGALLAALVLTSTRPRSLETS